MKEKKKWELVESEGKKRGYFGKENVKKLDIWLAYIIIFLKMSMHS